MGQAPFTNDNHVFANLGDGTYFHSGLLAIRAAIASKANITYKILYNDAVAMTGGQPVDGTLTVPQITHQVAAEGATKILFRREIADAADPLAKTNELVEEYRKRFANPFIAAQRGYVDDVIEARETRRTIATALEMLEHKRVDRPQRKHGNIPL